ncbi:hypothetical protein HOE37_00595 [Candidatus Woesearchaeota archaeon]|jgi:hypothetical protein|nr:hypothetical protein [Candidatus Woesearchaeota archaeon]MBT4110334.1 hypothetical protein [Candidatus Woesearchaeota archaeon]MBT4336142.1 hypothetical protein [Candidatus Woesearchaeota archaeon]MBT4468879.1 hypothetical protein [Candidatus Woesearchaeota archaeon]MBT6744802.1 hypothetical protein [Candidatus Woesearchaeota archaeon]
MIKANKIIGIVLLSLFLLGCGSGGGTKQIDYNFKQGTSGLQVSFMDNAPPKKIYENSNFNVILKMENKAAYDLVNGQITLSGINPQYFVFEKKTETFSILEGRNLYLPDGGVSYIEFPAKSEKLFLNAESYQGKYFLNIDFDSTMEFVDTICINPNLYSVYDAGCQIEDRKSYSGQGAPLAVVEVEEIIHPETVGGQVEFRFLLRNRGQGEVEYIELTKAMLGSSEFDECKFKEGYFDSKKVLLTKQNQEALLVCKTHLKEQGSYTTTVLLDFNYHYEMQEVHNLMLYE